MRNEQGFSLMEVLMSMVLLGIVGSGIAPGLLMNFKTITRNELRSEAIAAAQELLDDLRTEDPTLLPTAEEDFEETTITVNSKDFVIRTTYCIEADICSSGRSRHLTLEVEYKNEEIYEVETVFTQLR